MKLRSTVLLALILLAAIAILLWRYLPAPSERYEEPPSPSRPDTPGQMTEPFQPLPRRLRVDRRKAALGRRLYHDTRLSGNGKLSCASCHNLKTAGTDQKFRSMGANGRATTVNTPTVLNSVFNFKQFWDGRAATLEDVIDEHLTDPAILGSSWRAVVEALRDDRRYQAEFSAAYRRGLQAATMRHALATFVSSLITPGAPFDRYLRGDEAALNDFEKEGYRLFKTYGCAACHQGVNIGGNMFNTFGVMANIFAEKGKGSRADLGRFNVTGVERDRHSFKVPSLRNVARTPPYFHDGSAASLPEAINVMGRYQLGRHLTAREVVLITSFLNTLTGDIKEQSHE